jgi:hypothetical protein
LDYDHEIVHYKLPDGTIESSLLLVIPSFRLTRQAILVNTRTLACEVMSFQSMTTSEEEEVTGKKNAHAAIKLKKKRVDEEDVYAIDYSDAVELDI